MATPSAAEDGFAVKLLAAVREGQVDAVRALLTASSGSNSGGGGGGGEAGGVAWDRPCKYGTALHIAAYLGQTALVRALLNAGADVNARNDEGDTPLHKAALTGRVQVVEMLLQHPDVDLAAENAEAQSALAIARNRDVVALLRSAIAAYVTQTSKQLMGAARSGQVAAVLELLAKPNAKLLDLNLHDEKNGNTLLHYLAKADNKELVVRCIQQGGDPTQLNKANQTPADLATNEQLRAYLSQARQQMIAATGAATAGPTGPILEGAIDLWSNYATGWRPRWLAIENGMLFIYKTQADVASGSSQGSVRLAGATLLARKDDPRCFLLRGRNSVTYTFRAATETARGQWLRKLAHTGRGTSSAVDAVTSGRLNVVGRRTSSGSTSDADAGAMVLSSPSDLALSTPAAASGRSSGLPAGTLPLRSGAPADVEPSYHDSLDTVLSNLRFQRQAIERMLREATGIVNSDERLVQIRYRSRWSLPAREASGSIASDNFASATAGLVDQLSSAIRTAEARVEFWRHKYEREGKTRHALEESLQALAIEQGAMEKQATRLIGLAQQHGAAAAPAAPAAVPTAAAVDEDAGDDDHDDEFFDVAELESDVAGTTAGSASVPTPLPTPSDAGALGPTVPRRTELPALMFDRSNISLWTVIKDFVGKDLSKIAVPVYFNEPLSFLQKFSEDVEYHFLLDAANRATSSLERLAYVAAFAISPYSATTRTAKPFNPILGETFEMMRDDLGYRYFAEQVSHHPGDRMRLAQPISACYCESPNYRYWAEAHIKNRFLGNTLEVNPSGAFHVLLKRTNEHFVWHRVKTVVNNVIIGNMYVDNYGDMEIVNITTGERCVVQFKPRSWWGKNYGDIDGSIFNSQEEQPQFKLVGTWLDSISLLPAAAPATGAPPPRVLWTKHKPLANGNKYYHFSKFCLGLNELLPGMKETIAPTDSRLRPDQRAMELGQLDLAVQEKLRLEEKQRAIRRERHDRGEEWAPRWFKRAVDTDTGEEYWAFQGDYWESRERGKWDNVADLF